MKNILFAVFVSLLAAVPALSQSSEAKPTQPKTITISEAQSKPPAPVKTEGKVKPPFRPTKDQIRQAQSLLRDKSLYKGEATGTYNDDTRAAIRGFQKESGLEATGNLNRATLEKMNIALTESQKAAPEKSKDTESPVAGSKASGPSASEAKPKRPAIFRATKQQITEAQKILKAGTMYAGDESGKLDDATRSGLKKYQEANGLKVTGTLNRVTLEKMGIALTDSQKSSGEGQ